MSVEIMVKMVAIGGHNGGRSGGHNSDNTILISL